MFLFDPERHRQLEPIPWQPQAAQAWLESFANDALQHWKSQQNWPLHPRDAADFQPGNASLFSLYCGSMGVWLALLRLARAGFCAWPEDLGRTFIQLHERYCESPDTGERVPSWFLGESSLLTMLALLEVPGADEQLLLCLENNQENPTREALWGAPGSMLGALFLWEKTGETRWKDAYLQNVEALWKSWFLDVEVGIWLWEQDMYGQHTRYIGAGHGWAGNLYPLWRGFSLLSPVQQRQLQERTLEGLTRLARSSQGLTNWPPLPKPLPNRPEKMLVQWCHGAPGMLTALRHAPLPEAHSLLLQAGELIATAGPLAKAPGICHGTDGNGAALLELFRRTGDERWLTAARQFGSWAILQSTDEQQRHGQRRFSLWTGDAGLACFLVDCLEAKNPGLAGVDWLLPPA